MVRGTQQRVQRPPLALVGVHQLRRRVLALLQAHDACSHALTEPSVHELRLAARHLQSVLEVLHGLNPGAVRKARRQIADLLHLTGPLRDRQLSHAAIAIGLRDRVLRGRLLKHVMREERSEATRVARRLERSDRAHLIWLGAMSMDPFSASAVRKALQQALSRRRKRLRERMAMVRPDHPHGLHKVRLALKRYRYVLETFEDHLPAPVRSVRAGLKRIQQRLGHWHDEQVLVEWLSERCDHFTGIAKIRCETLVKEMTVRCDREQRRLVIRTRTILSTPLSRL